MARVLVDGVERPGLAALLAARGLALAADAQGATLALVGAAGGAFGLPHVVQVACAGLAATVLDAGADDVVLAADPDALVAARLAAVAGRRSATLTVGDLRIDLVERRVWRAGRAVALLPREYTLLVLLARAGGAVLGEARLRHALSGTACSPGTNVVAVHLSRLRARLGPGSTAIVTVKGQGYRLVAAPADGG